MKELLGQPEYLHLLVNPVLTHALPLAAAALLLALIFGGGAATRLALILVVIAAAAVWPAVHYGEQGYDRMQSVADATGGEWLDVHRHRADEWAWVFYASAGSALLALLLPLRWPRLRAALTWLSLIVTAAACVAGAYIGFAGGKVRHRELRHEEPPAAELQAARKEAEPKH